MRTLKRTKFSKHNAGDEPVWDESVESLPNVLNWYSYNKTQDDAKEYLLEYAKHINLIKPKFKLLSNSRERVNTAIAWLSRILINSECGTDEIKNRVMQEIDRLVNLREAKIETPDVTVDKRPTANVQENIKAKLAEYLGEINLQLDSILLSIRRNAKPNFSLKEWLRSNKVSSAQVKNISAYFRNHVLPELLDAQSGTCEQLAEAYSFLSSTQLKAYISVIQQFISDSDEQHLVQKQILIHSRSPRRKPKSPLKQVEKLKYLKEHNALKSVPPTRIIGAKSVIFYNPENRVITYYTCDNNHGLGVKGSTLLNYELTNTMCKIIRKPEDILPKLLTGGRVEVRNAIRDLKSKDREASGRINDKLLILRVF